VGMGEDVYRQSDVGREFFDRAEAATGLEIGKLCLEGPAEQLDRTDIAQPAIFTVSAAILATMRSILSPSQLAHFQPAFMAGLSLGEYSALYAAGAMTFETGVKLVARRGQLMQQAAEAVPSGMVSVMGLDEDRARKLCEAAAEGEILTCANFNCPGQIVLSGQSDACRRAIGLAEKFGATGTVPLKVAGAFHSEIMAPAAEKFARALDDVRFDHPNVPVISNVDALPYTSADQIRDKLLTQLTSPVRWAQSMEYLLAQGLRTPYEVGPGRALAGLMRRIDRDTNVVPVSSLAAVEEMKLQHP